MPRIQPKYDPRDLPCYPVAEAARFLHVPAATLRSWVRGREYSIGDAIRHAEKIIVPPDLNQNFLSFWNVVEAHVLCSLRKTHSISLRNVRIAIEEAQAKLGIEHLLRSNQLSCAGGEVFIKHYGELIQLTRSCQLALKNHLEVFLRRVEWDEKNLAIRLFPFINGYSHIEEKIIVIDPFFSFGKPVIQRNRISTRAINDRINAGEDIESIRGDYDLTPEELNRALSFETAA